MIISSQRHKNELFVRSCNYFHSISIIIEPRENAAETRASFFLRRELFSLKDHVNQGLME